MSSSSDSAVSLLRAQFNTMHEVLEGTVQGASREQLHWSPPQKGQPIGAQYVHIVTTEDAFINGILKGEAPLLATSFAGKAGFDEAPPQGGPWSEWANRVKVDLEQARTYAKAVYAATDQYLAQLSDADLERELDLSALGFGQQKLSWLLTILIANAGWHTGEISSLKGYQGLQGYPF